MNITKNTLKKIILEEISSLIESDFDWMNDDAPQISDDERIDQATENFRKKRNTKFERYEFESLVNALAQKHSPAEAREKAEEIKAQFENEAKSQEHARFQSLNPLEQQALRKYHSSYRRGNVKNATKEMVDSVGLDRAAEILRIGVDAITASISDERPNF